MMAFILLSVCTNCSSVNTVNDSHFDKDGNATYISQDSFTFTPTSPSKVKFYFEVSGSMNGFFRSCNPTNFKKDVWSVINKCSDVSEIYIMEDLKGERPRQMEQDAFRQSMNTGSFVAQNSTVISEMLDNILKNLNNGEIAVFVSDMRFDPVDLKAAKVLVSQYQSDVSKLFKQYGKSVSMVCAISDFINKSGKTITDRAPYYFLIIGDDSRVAKVRNLISSVLYYTNDFVDNIDFGFNYGRPIYTFGVPRMCYQMDDKQPTFLAYEEEDDVDTCTIKLKISLENYRWLMRDEKYFEKAFNVNSIYDSPVIVSDIKIDKQNILATVQLKVFNMVLDSEVLEWSLDLPNEDYTNMTEFFDNATDPNDPTKSYSVKNFCDGLLDGLTNKTKPNYILISKKS